MPEMKHNFTKGRMNKDLDERLVPKGEYRDALNIEVSTSEGSNIGALQTTLGNLVVSQPNTGSINYLSEQPSVVGKIEDARNNRILYFVNKPVDEHGKGEDLIISYNVETGVSEVVFRDIWQFETDVTQTSNSSAFFYVTDVHGVKPNMSISRITGGVLNGTTTWPFNPTVSQVSRSDNKITVKNNDTTNSWAVGNKIRFNSKRILNFKTTLEDNNLITAINIIDDLLFWTDNDDEPKKINIPRSILGSQNSPGVPTDIAGDFLPTKLIVNGGNVYTNVTTGVSQTKGFVEHSHVTVIRQAPTMRPKIHLAKTKRNLAYNSSTDSFTSANVDGTTAAMNWYDSGGDILESGDTVTVTLTNIFTLDYQVNDILIFSLTTIDPTDGVEEFSIMATITAISGLPNQTLTVLIDSIDSDVEDIDDIWNVTLKQEKPLFEFKFPRFATRYKYEDGEYSAFGPWSEVAFIPSEFDYLPKKGYNLGMVNNARWIGIRDFIPYNIPLDVVEVDILYKEEDSPNIYTVKTIKDISIIPSEPADDEWNSTALINGVTTTVGNTGFFVLEKDLIHATLPANQLLRPWDNVPRKALAQEVTGNRVVYGNYIQNFDLTKSSGQRYSPNIDVMIVDRLNTYDTINYDPTAAITTVVPTVLRQPEKSIKSIRTYQVGLIYADEFGREIPVQSNDTGTFTIDKNRANKYNQIRARVQTGPPHWAKYFRYYVKETSNEYYNLAMDRWYDAADGNIWLAFPSAERNKVDEETFLILKKGHDTDDFVKEKARYKIIDISNDAPDYIKQEKSDFESGLCVFHNDGLIRTGSDFFVIENTSVTTSALDQPVLDLKAGRGEFAIRVTHSGKKSAWYNLVTVTKQDGVTSHSKFIVDRIFEDDTAFSLNPSATAHLTGTRIEIQQIVYKNKPEFDGRFFVKIYKDSLIDKYMYRSKPVKSYVVRHARRHVTLAGTGDENKDFWDKGQYGGGWVDVVNQQQSGNPDVTGWFIDYAVGNYQGQGDEKDQGIGFYQPANGGKGTYLQISYSHIYGANNGNKNPQIDAANHGGEMAFRGAIETPGTLIRWSSDPDQVVYEIKSSFGYIATNNSGNFYNSRALPMMPGKKIDYDYTTLVNNWGSNNKHRPSNHRHRFNLHIQTIEQETPTGKIIPAGLPVGLDPSWDGTGNVAEPQLSGSWHPLDIGARNGTSVNGYGSTTAKGHPYFGSGTTYSNREQNSTSGSGGGVSKKDVALGSGGVDIPIKWANSGPTQGFSAVRATSQFLEVLEEVEENIENFSSTNPGIWETEPKQDVGLDIYYEASRSLRTEAFDATNGDEHGVDDAGNLVYQNLEYYNCYSFANGVESNRIRDDYNTLKIAKGVKASTTLAEQFKEERRETGLIFSGIYNSTSGVNNLNQFIQAENITKDLNPTYGSIQKLYGRDTDLLALCEDKVLKILANKDALFNADGNMNVTSNNAVLGQAVPFVGDYGISTNPESFAADEFRCYFADKQRGAVVRLSRDGLTNIAEHGMEDYFSDNLTFAKSSIGSFDTVKKTYNLTLKDYGTANGLSAEVATDNTISFSETVKGWTSFKSFIQSSGGISLNNSYYTFNSGNMWIHHENYSSSTPKNNNFYDVQYDSSVTFMFNENPSSVKSFNTLNYEGTQSKITENDSDNQYYNNNSKAGWYCSSIQTDLQDGKQLEFKDKEGKWFNTIYGLATTLSNLDEKEFSVQGIGNASVITGGNPAPTLFDLTVTGVDGSCTISCGTPIDVQGAPGQYKISMNIGTTPGIAKIVFNTGTVNTKVPMPDELVATFNGVTKNNLSSRVGGYLQGLIGGEKDKTPCPSPPDYFQTITIAGGTTQRNNMCQPITNHPMDILEYDVGTGGWNNTGTTTIPLYGPNALAKSSMGSLTTTGYATKGAQTINNTDWWVRDATMYISVPIGYSGNGILDLVINAPFAGTRWFLNITCPEDANAIPSSAIVTGGNTVCDATVNTTVYHQMVTGVNYGQVPGDFRVNDWVFADQKGTTPLPAGRYKMTNPAGAHFNVLVGTTDQKGDNVPGIISTITAC